MKHTLFSKTVQISCAKAHVILRTRPMRFYACVIFDAIIRNKKTQRSLSESTLSNTVFICAPVHSKWLAWSRGAELVHVVNWCHCTIVYIMPSSWCHVNFFIVIKSCDYVLLQLLLAVLLSSYCLIPATSFYVPGVAPRDYTQDETVDIKVSFLGSN